METLGILVIFGVSTIDGTLTHGRSAVGQPPQLAISHAWGNEMGLEGDTISVRCPVNAGRDSPVYYRWFRVRLLTFKLPKSSPVLKEQEEIMENQRGDFRLGGQANRKLTIKRLSKETSGAFTCRAVNGFGSKVLIPT